MQCLASQIVCFAETSKPLSNSLCCNKGAHFAQNQKKVFSFKVCVNSAYVQTSDETPSVMNFSDKMEILQKAQVVIISAAFVGLAQKEAIDTVELHLSFTLMLCFDTVV